MSQSTLIRSISSQVPDLFSDLKDVPEVKSIIIDLSGPEGQIALSGSCKHLNQIFSNDHFNARINELYPQLREYQFEFQHLSIDFQDNCGKIVFCTLSRGVFKANNSFFAGVAAKLAERIKKEKISPSESARATQMGWFSQADSDDDNFFWSGHEEFQDYHECLAGLEKWTPEKSLPRSLKFYKRELESEFEYAQEIIAAPGNQEALEKALDLTEHAITHDLEQDEGICGQIRSRINGCSVGVRDAIWSELYEKCGDRCLEGESQEAQNQWAQENFPQFLFPLSHIIWKQKTNLPRPKTSDEGGFFLEELF